MAASSLFSTSLFVCLVLLFSFNLPTCTLSQTASEHSFPIIRPAYERSNIPNSDVPLLEFPLNLEFLQAEFFLSSSLGHGLDHVAPNLTRGGPSPIGARKANLDSFTSDIITQFGYQQVGHLRAILKSIEGFPRPLMDLSSHNFAKLMDKAFEHSLEPSFNPYANSINFLLASYLLPYVALTSYEGINPHLQGQLSRRLCGGLLGVQSAQDAVIRSLLYQNATMKVEPYGITVAEFTDRLSELRNHLGRAGSKDEGFVVPSVSGAQRKSVGNLLAENQYFICYQRTPKEILRIMHGKGTAASPGGFFPAGAGGRIATSYQHNNA